MKKAGLFLFAVLLVMGLAVSSDAVVKKKEMGKSAGMAACGEDCGCEGSHMEKLKALELDEKQQEAVQTIHLRTKKVMIRNKADVQIAEIELKEILSKDPVDLKAAEETVKKIEGMKADMRMLHIKTMEEIKANLTPEQKKKFTSMMGMGMGKMGHGKDMKRKCNMHSMDNMEEMDPGQHEGGTTPMQHMHH